MGQISPQISANNKLLFEDRAAHEWYRFVLSFPAHLVRDYLDRFAISHDHQVLDPFCGTGTTLVECKKNGVPSVGIEANPMAYFASKVKVDWSPDPEGLIQHAQQIAESAVSKLRSQGIEENPALPIPIESICLRKLPVEQENLLLKDSISPLPLHKALVLLESIDENRDPQFYDHERLAFAKTSVFSSSNIHFGPEVGIGAAKKDAPVIDAWMAEIRVMAADLNKLKPLADVPAIVHHADSRSILDVLSPASIDAVITSPPYPNEKDYTRTTRLESILLGFIKNKEDLRMIKQRLIRSNTRNVYKADDDDRWISGFPEIQRLADEIETRRIELRKTSGFERQYSRVAKLYFGGMARHFADLRAILRPGASLAYVVGDQASYFQVMIRTGQILADICSSLGYQVVAIDLFRTRLATATKEQLREEVVVLRWPG